MRYVDLHAITEQIPNEKLIALETVNTSMLAMSDEQRMAKEKHGNSNWPPIKPFLEVATNRKFWYTESKNAGCLNDLEHFRPKGRVTDKNDILIYWYWFLAFNPINYRLSSQIPNRLNSNEVLGETGGKENRFPLFSDAMHGNNLAEIDNELPVLLDPCNEGDTLLLEFSPEGRPVASQQFSKDAIAIERVSKSNLLLNLDYPTFNEERERLYNRIQGLVESGEQYFADENDALNDTKQDLQELMADDAEYSKVAECYIRCFRDRIWVEDLILDK